MIWRRSAHPFLTNITPSTRRLTSAQSLCTRFLTTMAPSTTTKKKAATTKRKTEDQPDDPASSKPAASKKAKGPTVPLHAHLPNNRSFPTKLEFPQKKDDTLRISAWNVCGINACEKKGLKTYLTAEDPDVIILSETKMQAEPDIMHIKHQFKYRYWGGDETKGYGSCDTTSIFSFANKTESDISVLGSGGLKWTLIDTWTTAGVAILSKHKPIEVVYGLPTAKDQSSTKGHIRNAASNWNKIAGYTQEECDGLNSQLSPPQDSGHEKLVDVWRELNPDLEGHYTYFSYRFGCREKGIGWRIDAFIVSQRVFESVKTCEIRQECYGASDHVPIVIEIALSP
ncbi:hypothetical protein PGTUg99_017634 [Puccinia graminis f. sp. tritici]|uniref:Endonuclease/exonuclease/phosphatase domain-containing protein n=1 Tax=Puccinia graminis f. sp. tritici TaxID=56615 RepID=A0A5B0M7W6_PUCGR|nr:hypothetical protein PGTUg99_017634 [Puccinia graminis f. sp. tritici]